MKRLYFIFLLFGFSLLLSLCACAAEAGVSEEGTEIWIPVLVALGIGLAAAGITLFFMYRSMSTVRKQRHADDYADSGSFRLSECRDVFLYSRVTRIRVNTNNNNKR